MPSVSVPFDFTWKWVPNENRMLQFRAMLPDWDIHDTKKKICSGHIRQIAVSAHLKHFTLFFSTADRNRSSILSSKEMTLKEKRPLPTSKGTKATHRTGLGAGKYDGIVEHLHVLLELEARTQYSPCLDYLTVVPGPGGFSNESITDDGRCKMCEWCYNIVDHYDVDREVVSIAMNYLDRHVANKKANATDGTSISKLDFQLLSLLHCFLPRSFMVTSLLESMVGKSNFMSTCLPTWLVGGFQPAI